MEVNNPGFHPLGRSVLVELYEPDRGTGIIQLPPNVRAKTSMVEQRAIIVEVGPEAWTDESKPRAVPGDRVLITRYAGHMAMGIRPGYEDRAYRIVNANDVFVRIDTEAELEVVEERSVANG